MRRSLAFFSLLASVPGLAWAQEPKLVNCRTLEAAGNFVGPDEVIVDDMVCQKAKPGSDAAKAQPPKPVMGVTISDTPADDVVGAARAAEKRIAARKEKEDAEAQHSAPPPMATAAPVEATSPTPANVPETTASSPAPAKVAESIVAPAEKAAPAPVAEAAAAIPARDPAPASKPVLPESTPRPAWAEAATAPSSVQPSKPAANEIVISSAPSSSASSAPVATSPATARNTRPPAEVAAAPAGVPPAATTPIAEANPAVASADVAPLASAPAEALPPADPSHPATSSGFYDANAPKRSANAAARTNSGFASAEQVNAGLVPGATSIPPSSQPASAEAAVAPTSAAEAEPQRTTIAASRVAFDDPDRDRSVKLGDFAQPKEVSPDPSAEHRTSVDPSDADGFQDRQRPECTKNITIGGLQGERLVLGVPTWAAKWIEKNERRMPEICFSETPMKSARNYLVVFSTPGGSASKDLGEAALNAAKGGISGVGTFTTSYGSTWHYSYDRNVGTTVLTQDDADEPLGQPGQVLYATAYTEEGVPVSQRWPSQLKKEFKAGEKNPKKLKGKNEALERICEDLLNQMVEDIQKF